MFEDLRAETRGVANRVNGIVRTCSLAPPPEWRKTVEKDERTFDKKKPAIAGMRNGENLKGLVFCVGGKNDHLLRKFVLETVTIAAFVTPQTQKRF